VRVLHCGQQFRSNISKESIKKEEKESSEKQKNRILQVHLKGKIYVFTFLKGSIYKSTHKYYFFADPNGKT
jgi:hypothetical protein